MKQIIVLTFFITLFIKSYSQEKKVNFQLLAGTTLSVPKTSDLTNSNITGAPKIRSYINIGAFILPNLNYALNEKTSLDFGLGFYLDRFSIEDEIGYVISKGNRNISQIQTPINFNFHFGNSNSYQFGIGAFTAFLISAKEKGETRIESSAFYYNDENPALDPLVDRNAAVNYDKDLKSKYNSVGIGAFIQLKKNISFSENTKGFLLLKINQYFNSIKNADSNSNLNEYVDSNNEKEPTTVNFGVGINL
ncbi:outer membrane beta-barrel protein [Algibacter sp. L1A34]|uniref:outer membrane beta-barrel protein n=1 Tax=Algibacter sp. L1A34 TaxID=2686365 RepID=UPI00131DEB17|nr:outer membrane beta-barrel protein [Algibacter sp. L1A34]